MLVHIAGMLLVLRGSIRADNSLQSTPVGDSRGTSEEQFYAQQRRKLFEEYRSCTGDTASVALSRVVAWRERLYRQVETPEYRRALRDYRAHTGAGTDASPCEVLRWRHKRRREIEELEERLSSSVVREADRLADTLKGRLELSAGTSSPLDLADVPFGVTATSLRMAFPKAYGDTLTAQTSSTLRAEGVAIDSKRFDVQFLLDPAGRYVGYRIDGTRYPPDSLDGVVRSEARHLVRWMERRAGPSADTYRIGLFDIKPGHLAPYARWRREGREATVGIAASNRHFFARAEVRADTSITAPAAPAAGE
jgi:hypothetical protein